MRTREQVATIETIAKYVIGFALLVFLMVEIIRTSLIVSAG
jgi:hypothetical protein